MRARCFAKQAGLTLVEMILSLILVGLMAGMILPLFQSGVTSSTAPITRLESVAELEAVMANIKAAVRLPSTDSSQQTVYQKRGSGMQKLKTDIENATIFAKWLPSGDSSITADVTGPFKLGLKAQGGLDADTDQNNVLEVTLKNADGASLTYVFCEGTNYQKGFVEEGE